MHTRITRENPYGYSRYGFAWENVPKAGTAHLDFGCYDGSFLASLSSKEIDRLVGVDVSKNAIDKAHEKYPNIEIVHIDKTVPLCFEDGEFTSITILDVLEHIDQQSALLDELNRVLKEDGVLIVTVPGRHIFSFLDIGNLKFRFPRLHRWYYCRKYSMSEYEQRYVCNPDGLVGDISSDKRWHEHFSKKKLERLLSNSGFSMVEFDGSGFFNRIIRGTNFLLGKVGFFYRVLKKLELLDARFFKSANLFCIALKN
jgi:ubiquinone/menaquinone biosynthesis C-methylase UbiE